MSYLTEVAKAREARWQQLLSSFPKTHFLFILDCQGRYLDLRVPDPSRLWIPEAEHKGKTFDEILPHDLGVDRRYFFEKALASRETQQYSYPHPITADRHMTCIITPIKGERGEIEEVLMQVFDTAIALVPAANVLPPHEPNS